VTKKESKITLKPGMWIISSLSLRAAGIVLVEFAVAMKRTCHGRALSSKGHPDSLQISHVSLSILS
jgi:hypothetical protein